MCPAVARVGLSQVALAGYFTLAAIYSLFAGPPEISPGAERASATSESQDADSASKKHTVRVAGIVLKWLRTDKAANFKRVEPMIRQAAEGGAKIVCTTECFLDGYSIADKSIPLDQYRALGEPIPDGKYFCQLADLAKELKIYLIAGMLEACGEDRYNTAVVLGPDGRLIGKYRKQMLEHELVRNTPGTESKAFDTEYGRVGVMICADRRFREIVSGICDAGADFLICPSGGMFGSKKNDPIVQERSRETGKYIVFVHPAEFLVTDPTGEMVSRTILGDRLLITPEQVGQAEDKNQVFFFDFTPPATRILRSTHIFSYGGEVAVKHVL